ncbi:MAG: hypothetical protein ACFE9S_04125 [Candidatus Hermodarchaeota archaeon]
MLLQYFYPDLITITVSYILFWLVIIILILYPKIRLRKVVKRIENLNKNLKQEDDEIKKI